MIVTCPACAARFKLDRAKLAGKSLTLRCARCRTAFQVELPRLPSSGAAPTRVMVAHSDKELCTTITTILQRAGIICQSGYDGKEVLALMDAAPPHVAVVDVALQGLYAFEVVETVRRRHGLDKVKIILLSSVYNKAAYKRSPHSLYGADDYIEKHHLPNDLVLKINRLLVDAAPAAESSEQGEQEAAGKQLSAAEGISQSVAFIDTVNRKIRTAEDREISAKHLPERERAERLARIIVSDISLYYQDRIDEGILRGNWSELLAAEIKEARRLFSERFPTPEIQNSKILEAAFLDLLEKRRRELGA